MSFESREGHGERGLDGRPAGEVTIADLIPLSLRMGVLRIIVGEVRSREIVPMLQAMTTSRGSMCTIHARTPGGVSERIIELALSHGREMTVDQARRMAGNALDLIVYVTVEDETAIGGRKHRFVSHIEEVIGVGEQQPDLHHDRVRPRSGRPGGPAATCRSGSATNCCGSGTTPGMLTRYIEAGTGAWRRPRHTQLRRDERVMRDAARQRRTDRGARRRRLRGRSDPGGRRRCRHHPAGPAAGRLDQWLRRLLAAAPATTRVRAPPAPDAAGRRGRCAGALAFLVTGLPVVGLLVAIAVPGTPWLFTVGRAEQRAIARIEAVGEWTRRLKDVSGTGQGLQQAIIGTVATAPEEIEEEVRLLAARLQAGWQARTALLAFADDIADPVCDQVVAALILHLTDRGERLGDVLGLDRLGRRGRGRHPARGRGQAHPAPVRGPLPDRHDAADPGLRAGQPRLHAPVRHAVRPDRDDRARRRASSALLAWVRHDEPAAAARPASSPHPKLEEVVR